MVYDERYSSLDAGFPWPRDGRLFSSRSQSVGLTLEQGKYASVTLGYENENLHLGSRVPSMNENDISFI